MTLDPNVRAVLDKLGYVITKKDDHYEISDPAISNSTTRICSNHFTAEDVVEWHENLVRERQESAALEARRAEYDLLPGAERWKLELEAYATLSALRIFPQIVYETDVFDKFRPDLTVEQRCAVLDDYQIGDGVLMCAEEDIEEFGGELADEMFPPPRDATEAA